MNKTKIDTIKTKTITNTCREQLINNKTVLIMLIGVGTIVAVFFSMPLTDHANSTLCPRTYSANWFVNYNITPSSMAARCITNAHAELQPNSN
jgi:hypothetical protein